MPLRSGDRGWLDMVAATPINSEQEVPRMPSDSWLLLRYTRIHDIFIPKTPDCGRGWATPWHPRSSLATIMVTGSLPFGDSLATTALSSCQTHGDRNDRPTLRTH